MSENDHKSRENAIRDLLFERGEIRLDALAEQMGVSLATIRRDVTALAQRGVVERSHGAARIAEARTELGFSRRTQLNIAAKRAIAAAAGAQLRPGETVILDSSTTVLQFAHYLRVNPIPLSVFTNSLAIASELASVEEIAVTVMGGRLRPENMSLVGPFAQASLRGLWVDRLFLGASAISLDGIISSYDAEEAQVNALMIDRAKSCHVLADCTKLDTRETYEVAMFGPKMGLISDCAPPQALGDQLARAGSGLICAPPLTTPFEETVS